MKTGISPKWAVLAMCVLGNKYGLHCHWCKFMESDEGEVTCTNEKSKFCDGDRTRTWDGGGCAKECGLFELDDWYKNDKNDEYFKKSSRRQRNNAPK